MKFLYIHVIRSAEKPYAAQTDARGTAEYCIAILNVYRLDWTRVWLANEVAPPMSGTLTAQVTRQDLKQGSMNPTMATFFTFWTLAMY